MKKRNQLLALCALVILVLTVFACENPFIPGKYKEPAPPQAPSINVEVTPIGPYIKGEGVTMTAKASVSDGGELSYQWYSNSKNSSSGGKAVSGATGESYRPSTDMSSDNILEPSISYYYVQVTNTLNGKTTAATSRIIDVAVFDIPIGTTPIREVALNVTPPVKDGIPATLEGVTSTGSGYTIQSVSWSPPHNTFMSGGKYTIWITLQAESEHTFIALRTATVNGQAAAVENNNGTTLYLSCEFKQVDVRVVTGISIKTQPNDLTYDHGDTLRLHGLAVTLTYDSGEPEDVPFASFASRTVTTNLAHGITLSHTTHDGRPVVITCNNHSVNTNNLTVNKAEILSAIVNVTPPAKGDTPVTVAGVDATAGFTVGAVSWNPSHNPFEGNINYTATVTLTAKADYAFASGMTAHINNSAATVTNNPNGTKTLSFEFDKTLMGFVTGISVTGQPSKLIYTHGDALDLTGLVVTLHIENSADEIMTFSNESLFQTVPTHGSVLRHAAYDAQPVTVNYSGHNAYTNNLTVNKKALTLNTSAAEHTKVYDGTTTANGIANVTLVGIVGNDNVYIVDGQVNGEYTSADVPTKTVNITSVLLDGSAASNYTVTLPVDNVTLTGVGNVGITPKPLTVTATHTKGYDGTTDADGVVITLGGVISPDTVTPGTFTAVYMNPNVGANSIRITDLQLTGASAGNYSVPATVTVGVSGITKAEPIVTWPTNVSVNLGRTLSDVSLTSYTNTGGTPGTFSWTIPSTVVDGTPGPGNLFNMTFTPTNTNNYNTVQNNVSVTVNPQVSFDPNGIGARFGTSYDTPGNPNPHEMIAPYNGTLVGKPPEPIRYYSVYYTFTGWYTNSTCTTPFYFNTPITSNITVYAGWILNSDLSSSNQFDELYEISVGAGSFQMGQSGDGTGTGYKANVTPIHTVTMSAFKIGKYEISQGMWTKVMGVNSTNNTASADRPANGLSWYSALVFCNKLSKLKGYTPAYSIGGSTDTADWGPVPTTSNATWDAVTIVAGSTGYRLPTEAQWEYAAKGGPSAHNPPYFFSGNDTNVYGITNFQPITYDYSSNKNELGILFMSGNVSEWCWDWYDAYTSSAQTNPTGPTSGTKRVTRGGGALASSIVIVGAVAYRDEAEWSAFPYRGNASAFIIGLRVARP